MYFVGYMCGQRVFLTELAAKGGCIIDDISLCLKWSPGVLCWSYEVHFVVIVEVLISYWLLV